MATTRRALLRKGNVVNLAEARSRREAGLPVQTDSANEASIEESLPPSEVQQADKGSTSVKSQNSETAVAVNSALAGPAQAETLENVGSKKSVQKHSSTPAKKKGNRTYNKAKVDAIRNAIANGTYVINPQRIADKFIEQEAKL